MIRWSFWVDAWEHPFNTWIRKTPDAFVDPLPMDLPADPPPTKVPGSKPKWKPSTSWDFSTWSIPIFSEGYTRTRVPSHTSYYTDLDRALDENIGTPFTEIPLWDDVNQAWSTGRTIGGMFTGGYWAKQVILQGAGRMMDLSERWKTDEQRIAEGPQ